MDTLLAYDFGTGGIKASLYAVDGTCLANGFAAYKTHFPAPKCHEQEPQAWWEATIESTHALFDAHPEYRDTVRGIGISGHSLGAVPLAKDGTLLQERTPIWSDSRADVEANRFFEQISLDAWYMRTGAGFPAAHYTIFKIMWLRDHEPEIFSRIHQIVGTKDYINYRLCGVMATDHSYASGCGVYDLSMRTYAPDLVALSGIDPAILPRIVPSTEILGTLTAKAADALGLPRTVQVVAGGVDNSCMSLGAGAFCEGRAYNSLGSSSWIAVSSEKPLLDVCKRPYVFEHVVPGQYVSALAIFSAGTTHNWVRDQLCKDLSMLAQQDGTSVYAHMDEETQASPPGANGLLFNPTFAGGNSLDVSPDVRGALVNLSLNHTRGDILRALSEGIAYGLRNALDELRHMTTVSEPLILVGGGANAAFWRQIYADIYQCSVIRTSIGQQAAALGAAVLAAVGTGLWADFSPMDKLIDEVDRHVPNQQNEAVYEAGLAHYRSLMQSLTQWQ